MENSKKENGVNNGEVYIEYLTKTLGVSREEIIDVVKRSGINCRRIAEFLIRHRSQQGEQQRQAN